MGRCAEEHVDSGQGLCDIEVADLIHSKSLLRFQRSARKEQPILVVQLHGRQSERPHRLQQPIVHLLTLVSLQNFRVNYMREFKPRMQPIPTTRTTTDSPIQ